MRRKTLKERANRIKASFPLTTESGVSGCTTDISSTGILFELAEKQEPGSVISFWVELNTPGGILKLACEGEVVRVVEENGRVMVAAKILTHSIKA